MSSLSRRFSRLSPASPVSGTSGTALFFIIAVLLYHVLAGALGQPSPQLATFSSGTGLQLIQAVAAIAAAYLLWREDTPLRVPLAWTGGAAILAVSAAAILGNDAGALTVAGVYLCLAGTGGSKTRAAGAIVLTMAAQAYWAPLGLTPFVEPILRFDTVLAGSLVALTIPGAGWQGTLISTPGGFSLQVAPGCSSVHNIALAVLCWMAFSRLERARWRLADLAVLAVVVACQLAANVARLYVISLSQPLYQFWHEGVGKHAFASLATMAAVVLSVVGTRWIDFRWPESRRPAIGPKASMAVGGA